MYIMYIDESGDTTPISQGGKDFLVLTGCVILESDKILIEKKFRAIKEYYYQDADIEIKSNFLRYANPDVVINSPLKLHDREQYNQLETDVTKLLQDIPVTLFSIAIHKPTYWQEYPAQNPYEIAYIHLVEQFQNYLAAKQALGICIIDPREGQVHKSFIGLELDKVHHALRWEQNDHWEACPNIIERVLFATSDRTIGIQLADLYCYPIFHVLMYNKRFEDYWRYQKITLPKLSSAEIKLYPEVSKKGLGCFQ